MSFITRVKTHYRFTREEIKHFIILSLVFGFLFSFDDWGKEVFEPSTGFFNLIAGIIIAAIGIFVHDAGHRLMALHLKHKIKASIWWTGVGISSILCVVSRGVTANYILLAESFEVELLKRERFGTFQYRTKLSEISSIAVMGGIFNLLLATIIKFFAGLGGLTEGFLINLIWFNVIYGVIHYFPFPPLDGSKIIYDSRWFYCFTLVGALIYGYLLLTPLSIFLSLLLALVLAAIAVILYLTIK